MASMTYSTTPRSARQVLTVRKPLENVEGGSTMQAQRPGASAPYPEDSITTLTIANAMTQLRAMRDQVRAGHPRADHIRLDMIAYSDEIASMLDADARGEFTTRAVWGTGDVLDVAMLAARAGLTPALLRGVCGVAVVR